MKNLKSLKYISMSKFSKGQYIPIIHGILEPFAEGIPHSISTKPFEIYQNSRFVMFIGSNQK